MITFFICLALLIIGFLTYGKIVENIFRPDKRLTLCVLPALDRFLAPFPALSGDRVFIFGSYSAQFLLQPFRTICAACYQSCRASCSADA